MDPRVFDDWEGGQRTFMGLEISPGIFEMTYEVLMEIWNQQGPQSVSYTHLTLPTILRV